MVSVGMPEALTDGGEEGPDGGWGQLVCQVPGCGRDLAGLKEYHQRHRICDGHIKLPQVHMMSWMAGMQCTVVHVKRLTCSRCS
jgi:hypothetical protein